MKCFYHRADHDGQASGYLVKQKYPDAELVGINYGDDFPGDMIMDDEDVYMVDFTLQPFSEMIRFAGIVKAKGGELIWIDHHKSAIEAYYDAVAKNETEEIAGIRTQTEAACAITWRYLYGVESMPRFIQLLSDYDIWEHDRSPDILPLHYGLRARETHPSTVVFWDSLYDGNVLNEIRDYGQTILNYITYENRKYAEATAFETEIAGYRAIAINRMMINSKIFEELEGAERYEVQILFGWQKIRWRCQLFSIGDLVDVSKIAVQFGGGGHAGAAGFQTEMLPFKLGGIE